MARLPFSLRYSSNELDRITDGIKLHPATCECWRALRLLNGSEGANIILRMSAIALTREVRALARLEGWAASDLLLSFEARRRRLAPPAITAKPLRGDDGGAPVRMNLRFTSRQ